MAGTAPSDIALPDSAGSSSALTVWGTGKPRRQFIYSLVRAGGGTAGSRTPPQACSLWGGLRVWANPGGAVARPHWVPVGAWPHSSELSGRKDSVRWG